MLLLENGADINAQGGLYGSALEAASYAGNEKVVMLLLKNGADINAQGGSYSSALKAASYVGNEKVVMLLLENGADVNAHDEIFDSALQVASLRGHKEVVELLLRNGADINAQGERYGSALQAISYAGNEKLMKLPLEKRANVDDQSAPLQEASNALEKKVERLLKKGANVNAQGKKFGKTLQAASSRSHDEWWIRADVNAQSGQQEKALQATSYKGYESDALQEAGERYLTLAARTQVPLPEATEDYSSGSRYEIMSDNDEDAAISDLLATGNNSAGSEDETMSGGVSRATGDNSSGSGYEIMSDEDEDVAVSDLTPPEYDPPLASLRDRISNPVEYFDRLSNLAHLVYQHSTLQIYRNNHSPRTVAENKTRFEPCPGYPKSLEGLMPDGFDPIPDSEVKRICQDLGVTHNAFANDLLEILECRNVNAQTYSNLRRLQHDGFCQQKFSMLTIDPYRQNVARLLPIDVQHILQILREIESVLRKVADSARPTPPATSSAKMLFEQASGEQDDLLLSVPCCTRFLAIFGLVRASSSDPSIKLSIPAVLRLVVNTVDLAVASYAGAHVSRFDEEYLGEDITVIDVLGPFTSLRGLQIPSIKLSRCQLQCLDSFHNSKPVWVFSPSDWEPRGHLFLSTKVEDFADIWGPLWKVIDPELHDSCTRYVVGNGSIYKWKSQKTTPRLLENETLCHWISNTTIQAGSGYSPDTEEPVFPDIIDENFDGNETLLIGAVAAGCERLTTNRDCSFDLNKRRSVLDHDGRVQMLGTMREHTYKDSETYQLQAGHGGMAVSASKQYKRRGQSLKQALVELWTTTPEVRDPQILQDFCGLEVSLCTQNAQRVQLGRILGLGSMCQYLRSFRWQTDCAKQAYFNALRDFKEDSDALLHLWERHTQYQEDFGRAVLICLQALEKTGVNHEGQLSAFLSSEVTARPELIALDPKAHSWIGLLKDSEHSCCMAVIGDECLGFKHELGATCDRSGRSVLRTALVINGRNKPRGILKRRAYSHEATDGWTSRWSVRAMRASLDVWLGRHGTLRLVSHLPDGTLIMEWRASPFTTAVKSFIDKEKPHREYSENIGKKARRTRPIPLFVMSNQ